MPETENRFIQFHGRMHGSDLILVDPVRGPFYTIGQGITEAVARGAASEATRMCVWVNPGVYTEALIMATFVDVKAVGTPEQTVIQQTDATVVTLITSSVIEGFTIRLITPTVARNMVVDAGVAATSCFIVDCLFTITTPGALNNLIVYLSAASQVVIRGCRGPEAGIGGTGSNVYVSNDTVAATITLIDCMFVHNNANGRHLASGIAGTWRSINNTFRGTSRVVTAWSLGTYLGTGNRYSTVGNADQFAMTGGSFTEKTGPQAYEVYSGMDIGDAIAAAAADIPAPSATAPYTVVIYPGQYNEAITGADFVHLKGVDRDAVVIFRGNTDIVTLGAITETIENVTLRMVTPLAARDLILVSGAGAITLKNIRFEVTTPGGFANRLIALSAVATVDVQDCFIIAYAGGAAAAAIGIEANTGIVRARNCDFTFNNTGAFVYSCAGAAGILTLDHCRAAGTATHLRSGNATAILRVRESQYRSILRTTGNIVDESPYPPMAAYYHRYVRNWAALTNVNARVGGGGGVALSGGDSVRLLINDNNVADLAGTDQLAEASGAVSSAFTALRTPRYVITTSLDTLRVTSRNFYGLRQTLGGAVPTGAGAENYAGFDWDGTNFRAVSSNGAGVGAQTNLTSPSLGVRHVLEVIVLGGVQVEFYVDGVLVATHSTVAGLPTGAMDWQELIATTGAGAATTSNITVSDGFIVECPA